MAKYPIVIYGGSGYTGMLIMDWLIDQNIPFTAVGRSASRIKQMMAERVVRLESATYEIIETEHNVDALTKIFRGAKVLCNTVGPFMDFGAEAAEAALRAGCHYIDTCGEQAYVRKLRDEFGESFRQAGLLLSPGTAYMHGFSEIAAELVLETPGIDAIETACICRGGRESSGITIASTASVFDMLRQEAVYLWENELVPHKIDSSFEIVCPDFARSVFSLPWGGTSLPIFYQSDPRVRSFISSVGFYDNDVQKMFHGLLQKWESEYKLLSKAEQDEILASLVESASPVMPARERTTLSRSLDFAVGRGQLVAARATVYGITSYSATGAMQAAAAIKLLDGETAKVGFASACKAFGHRYLLGFMEQRGLARATVTQL